MLNQHLHITHRTTSVPATSLSNLIGRFIPRRPVYQAGFAMMVLLVGFLVGYQVKRGNVNDTDLAKLRDELQQMKSVLTLSLLHQEAASERLKGIGWSNRTEGQAGEIIDALINVVKFDPNVNVRLAALNVLTRAGNKSGIHEELINELPRQPSPLVQIALIDFAVKTHEKISMEVFRNMLRREALNPFVQQRLKKALDQLNS